MSSLQYEFLWRVAFEAATSLLRQNEDVLTPINGRATQEWAEAELKRLRELECTDALSMLIRDIEDLVKTFELWKDLRKRTAATATEWARELLNADPSRPTRPTATEWALAAQELLDADANEEALDQDDDAPASQRHVARQRTASAWVHVAKLVQASSNETISNRQFYDEQIAPALVALATRCNHRGMSVVASVEYELGETAVTIAILQSATFHTHMMAMCASSGPNFDTFVIEMLKRANQFNFDVTNSIVARVLGFSKKELDS